MLRSQIMKKQKTALDNSNFAVNSRFPTFNLLIERFCTIVFTGDLILTFLFFYFTTTTTYFLLLLLHKTCQLG